jgi:hypothetical protein
MRQGKVYCFSDIISLIEARMIRRGSRNHIFTFFMDHFMELDAIFQKETWIDESSFMSDKLWTLLKIIWELRFDKGLKLFITIQINTIPEFGFSLMKIIDGV